MKKNTRCSLIQEATKQFSKVGFSKSSIRSICQSANISVAAINYHFGSKNKLIKEVVRNSIERFNTAIDEAEKASDGNLLHFLTHYAHGVEKLDPETIIIFREIFNNQTETESLHLMVSDIHLRLVKKACVIAELDSNYSSADNNVTLNRINIFSSLIAMEVIKKTLLPSQFSNKEYSTWVKQNISIIFNLN